MFPFILADNHCSSEDVYWNLSAEST